MHLGRIAIAAALAAAVVACSDVPTPVSPDVPGAKSLSASCGSNSGGGSPCAAGSLTPRSALITSDLPVVAFALGVPVNDPDAAYLAATTKIDFSGTADFANLNSINDATLTVTFDGAMNKRTVPGGGWASWSSPPNSESATPAVLFSGSTTRTLTLSSAQTTFGFEAEPDPFAVHDITATFYNGAAIIGTITRSVDGAAGARLFAASATGGDVITSVVISSTADFAIGQVRYAGGTGVITVLVDIKPGSSTNPINPGSKGTTPVAILTTASFDASTVDVSTVFLGGTPVSLKKNGTFHSSLEDLDLDGDLDLVLHFTTQLLPLPPGTTSLELTGETTGGAAIAGSDVVTLVP